MQILNEERSPIRRQAAEALRRARQLPVGAARNDLRQLAVGLLWLEKHGRAEHAVRRLTANPTGEQADQPITSGSVA